MQVEIEDENSYLKGEFVKENKIIEIIFITEPKMTETKFGNKVEGEVEYNGQGKEDPHIWTLNNTSARMLLKHFGKETKEWMGKKLPVEPSRTEKGYAIYIDQDALKKNFPTQKQIA